MDHLGYPFFIQRTRSAPARLLQKQKVCSEKQQGVERHEGIEGIQEQPSKPQWDSFIATFQQKFTDEERFR